jgi:outer membrane protein
MIRLRRSQCWALRGYGGAAARSRRRAKRQAWELGPGHPGLRSPLRVVLAVLICMLPGKLAAANLLQIYLDARQQDPVYAAARDAWAASQEKLPQARAGLLPSATLTANPSYTDRDIEFRNGTSTSGRFNSNGVTVSVTQPLFRMQNIAQYQGARVQLTQADSILAAAAQDLILRISQAYFDVLLAQDNLDLAIAQKAAIAEQLAIARRNYELGAVAITDAHDAQARFDLAVSLEITARNDLQNRREALQQITAKPTGPLDPLGPKFAARLPEPNNANGWVVRSVANSQQIATQKAAVELAQRELERNRYAHYPTVDAVASYSDTGVGQGTQGGVGNDTRTAVVGLQLSVPLFLGGSVSSQVRQAQANLSKTRQELEATQRQVTTAVKQAFLGVTSSVSQIAALETALLSSQSSLKSSMLGREVGIRTQVDVLDAQQQLFSARFNLAQARYGYVLNWIKLKAGAGELGEDDVRQVNEWLAAAGTGARAIPASIALRQPDDGGNAAAEPFWRSRTTAMPTIFSKANKPNAKEGGEVQSVPAGAAAGSVDADDPILQSNGDGSSAIERAATSTAAGLSGANGSSARVKGNGVSTHARSAAGSGTVRKAASTENGKKTGAKTKPARTASAPQI